MRAREAPTESFDAARPSDLYPDLYRPQQPSALDKAELWRARRERAWEAAGWLVCVLLLLTITLVAEHVFPAAFGLR